MQVKYVNVNIYFSFLFSDNILPICLPIKKTLHNRTPHQVIIAGWGLTQKSKGLISYTIIETDVKFNLQKGRQPSCRRQLFPLFQLKTADSSITNMRILHQLNYVLVSKKESIAVKGIQARQCFLQILEKEPNTFNMEWYHLVMENVAI